MELSKTHVRRLRHYWQGKSQGGGASLTDGVDLDLAAAGLIERQDRMGFAYFVTTKAGESALHAQKQLEVERRAPHHRLAGRLAAYLRDKGRITWENIELLVEPEPQKKQLIRPDVFSLVTTYDEKKIAPLVHEVKVSRADLLADIAKPEKRLGYSAVANAVFYVVPEGITHPGEIPEECGLLVERADGEFVELKRPQKRRVVLPRRIFMNLVLKPGAFTALF
jgi:hypothetical protein